MSFSCPVLERTAWGRGKLHLSGQGKRGDKPGFHRVCCQIVTVRAVISTVVFSAQRGRAARGAA